jgi:spore photoproduct lyase
MKRHKPAGLSISDEKSVTNILTEINSHALFADVSKPNQTHEKFITYDISCNEDFALHAKYHDWKRIFKFFKESEMIMGSFATKYVNYKLLDFNSEKKVRIRFSLMPQVYSDVLELNTSSIEERIKAIDQFTAAGYDVHINFSPVIVTQGWLHNYKVLFEQVNRYVHNKDEVKAEVIFLTHNEDKHLYNVSQKLPGEHLLWSPSTQENKVSQYGGENIRYKHDLKSGYIKEWTELHDQIIPWNTIRYIF